MNCWNYYSKTLSTILWHPDLPDVEGSALRQRVEQRIARQNLPVASRSWDEVAGSSRDSLPPEVACAETVVVRPGGPADFGPCPGTQGHRCCNYLTLNTYVGCTLGCTYCIMQSYLRNRTLEVLLPHQTQLERIRRLARERPGATVRVGTGEVGDSLLYDPLFDISRQFVEAFADIPNLRFELKTKTDYVEHLPEVPRGSSLVVGFSLNPPGVVTREEGWAATLNERLAAARCALEKGYRLAFHFDPIIYHSGWREAYGEVVKLLGEFSAAPVEWVSLGTLRYPLSLRSAIEERPYALEEFVQCRDGKMRYLQPLRAGIYRFMRDQLRQALPAAPVYLCMESSSVWRDFLRERSAPDRSASLKPIMRPLEGFERGCGITW
ncbi:spore photoproduct lyase [Alkalispirochaeta americana]|uniref:Spore photoproduct lyase n=2 Tax=Alkalispirochaeta americana TaxID=159291 RepID=A0A1N6RBY8_9SPIO|nr:spore photoproduct lyase [Alkalispirochaeta americana]